MIILDQSLEVRERMSQGYTDLQLMRGFDLKKFPYCIAKSLYGLVMIDLKNQITFPLLRTRAMQLARIGPRLVQITVNDGLEQEKVNGSGLPAAQK